MRGKQPLVLEMSLDYSATSPKLQKAPSALSTPINLLLHLLFIISIMTVRCSQMSNILALVHLFLSKSVLIVLD